MAMKIYSRDDFYRELEKHKFTRTGKLTASGKSEIWLTPDDQTITVSVHDEYPDYILDKILEEAGRLYLPLYDSNTR